MKQSKRRSKQEMADMISSWQQSGQSKKEFCEEHRIKAHTFQYWYQKYQAEQLGSQAESAFIRLSPSEEYPQRYLYTISYPNGVRLQIGREVSSTELLKLMGLV